jgi:hypothetical protein
MLMLQKYVEGSTFNIRGSRYFVEPRKYGRKAVGHRLILDFYFFARKLLPPISQTGTDKLLVISCPGLWDLLVLDFYVVLVWIYLQKRWKPLLPIHNIPHFE